MPTVVANGPLVSVITPSYNQASFIEETLKSVLSQDYPNVEYLIIDGGSTDGTQEILKKYSGRLSWISEKDQGQADAVNKGFRQAKGQILGWLNSDDTYQPGAIRKVVEFFGKRLDISMVYGEAYNTDARGKIIERHPTEDFDYERLAETCFICQPTVFLRRHVFETVGPLDVTLHFCLDYEYWMRIGKRFRVAYMPEPLATSRFHGAAKTFAKSRELHEEIISTVKRHYALVPLRTIYLYTYVTLMQKLMPNVQGLYPNGWATSHVTIFLRNNQAKSFTLLLCGYISRKMQPLTFKVTAGGKSVEGHVASQGRFIVREQFFAKEEALIDTEEAEGRGRPSTEVESSSLQGHPFSYRLARGCGYTIRRLAIIDDLGRQMVLFSKRVTLISLVALPFLILRNTVRINGRLCMREQFKSLFNLYRAVFASGRIT